MVLVAAGGWTALRSWAQGGRVRSKMENNSQINNSIKFELGNNGYIMLTMVGGVNEDLKKRLKAVRAWMVKWW